MEVLKFVVGLVLIGIGIASLVVTTRRHVQGRSDAPDVARWVASIAGLVIGLWLFIHGLVSMLHAHAGGS